MVHRCPYILGMCFVEFHMLVYTSLYRYPYSRVEGFPSNNKISDDLILVAFIKLLCANVMDQTYCMVSKLRSIYIHRQRRRRSVSG